MHTPGVHPHRAHDASCRGIALPFASILLLLIPLLAACGSRNAGPPPSGTSLTDDLQRTVQVDLPVERVATLAPNLTEIVFATGGGDRLVGVGNPDNHPPAVDSLPRYSTYPVDFEALAALMPELVLATDQINSPQTAEMLESIGIPVYFLSFRTMEDVFDGMHEVGRLLGTETTAKVVVDSLRREMATLRQHTQQVDERPDVLFLIGRRSLFSFGNGSYIHDWIELAGGHSITAELNTAAPILSEEFVITHAPEVIAGAWENVQPADLLEYHPAWKDVPALRNGRVYGVHADWVLRPGPRLVAGAWALARHLHPEQFAPSSDPTLD